MNSNDKIKDVKKAKGPSAFQKFLETKSVKDILSEKKQGSVLTLEHSMTVSTALKILKKHNYLSAPVVLAASVMDYDSGDFLGMLDASEILRKLCRETGIIDEMKKLEKKLNSDTLLEVFEQKFQKICEEFWTRKLIQVCGSDVTLLPTVYSSTDVKTLCQSMLFNTNGPVHRVALLQGSHVKAIVTQSDVMKFLYSHKKELGGVLSKKVSDLGLFDANKGVVCVTADTIALEAFHLMFEKKLSCVGVTDYDGKLIGNLSASDLRGLEVDRFTSLFRGTADFLKIAKALSRPYATILNAALNDLRALAIKKEDAFETLLDLVCKHRVHRAYIVDKDAKPLGIITLTDILSMLARM